MDYEDIIKLQEQSPIYSTGNNSHSLKQCMASFYDNDSDFERKEPHSQNQNQEHVSFEQAIDYVQNYVDIIDTPLEDIIQCLDRLQFAQDLDRMLLKKKILKRKSFLKRYRAKNRLPKIVYSFEQFSTVAPTNGLETEAEIKKKRNRVSAQISRDRKKQYYKQLQQKNHKLQEQLVRARLENEKLKNQTKEIEVNLKPKQFSQTLNNKLTRLLIFLGIICLIGMLKDSFMLTSQNIFKFKSNQKIDLISQFPYMDQVKMMQQGQQRVAQFLQEQQLEKSFVDPEAKKVSMDTEYLLLERNRQKLGIYEGITEKLMDMKRSIQKKTF